MHHSSNKPYFSVTLFLFSKASEDIAFEVTENRRLRLLHYRLTPLVQRIYTNSFIPYIVINCQSHWATFCR